MRAQRRLARGVSVTQPRVDTWSAAVFRARPRELLYARIFVIYQFYDARLPRPPRGGRNGIEFPAARQLFSTVAITMGH